MKRFISCITAFLILLSCLIATEATVAADEKWTSVQSKNFLLIGNASEKDIKQVAIKLEQFRDVFSRLFPGMKVNSPVPTTVIVFKNDRSYRPFKISSTTAGFFQPGQDVNYITLTTEARGALDPFNVIFHEYTHLLVENSIEDAPTWFNEGLAEYYSTFEISNDQKVRLGAPIANHVLLLRENRLLPLRTLFEVDHKSPYYNESNKQSIFYAQTWALMHYLMLNKNTERPKQLGEFVNLVAKKVPLEQAFTQSFNTTFDVMEKELRDYIRQDRYRVMHGHFERKLETDTALQTRLLNPAEVQAYLGDLLLHTNRAEAESYLTKAVELDPDLAIAHASLGMFYFRQGKGEEARKSLERAVAAKSQNYLIHYYYAFMLSRSRPDEVVVHGDYDEETAAKIREQLHKAIALRPDYPDAYNLLAFVNVVTGHEMDETISLLTKQLERLPNRGDLRFMLAQLYLRKDDYENGRQLLEQLVRSNAEAELVQRAHSLLTQVIRIEEQREQLRQENPARPFKTANNISGPIRGANTTEEREVQDPSTTLRNTLRRPGPGETQRQAILLRVDCEAKGIVFVVQTEEGLLRLRTDSFNEISLTTYNAALQRELTCGLRRPPIPVIVCYLATPNKQAKADGTLRSVEFVPADFQLNPK